MPSKQSFPPPLPPLISANESRSNSFCGVLTVVSFAYETIVPGPIYIDIYIYIERVHASGPMFVISYIYI